MIADEQRNEAVEQEEGSGTLALITEARHALAEARTLTDFRRVMESASVAADAAQRAAKLAQASGMAAEFVRAATEAANDAAAVRIEAQVSAGRILREMRDSGSLAERGRPIVNEPEESNGENVTQGNIKPATLDDLGISRKSSSLWQHLADIPDNVRVEYVDQAKENNHEITTAGLRRFAAGPSESREDEAITVDEAYNRVAKAITEMDRFDPRAVAAYAVENNRLQKFAELLGHAATWVNLATETLN